MKGRLVGLALALGFPGLTCADFVPLGDLPGGGFRSEARAISADGSTVVGASESAAGLEAFRWTREEGIVGLGSPPGGGVSTARGVSADGSVIVGGSFSALGNEAFRWTRDQGMVGLGDLPGGQFSSFAYGVSADGSVIVGRGNSGSSAAFRWTEATGMVSLGLGPTGRGSGALAVSADGRVVVGESTFVSAFLPTPAWRWTQETGQVGLGILPGGLPLSQAWGVSADGSVVVGLGGSASAPGDLREAFRWTQEGGIVGLGDLPGGRFLSFAWAVSADGSVVVGASESSIGLEAFIWDSANGMRSLRELLISQGDDLNGWQLRQATGVSADGRTIVGIGINPAGQTESWLVRLGTIPIPEPASLVLLGLGSLGLLCYRCGRRRAGVGR